MRAIERAKKKNEDPAAKEKGSAVLEEDVAAVTRKRPANKQRERKLKSVWRTVLFATRTLVTTRTR